MDINKWLDMNADSLQQSDKAGKGGSMGGAGWVPFAGSKRKAHEMEVDMDENEAECGPAPPKQYLVDKDVATTGTLQRGCRMALEKTDASLAVTQAEGMNASGSTERMEESVYKTAAHWFGSEDPSGHKFLNQIMRQPLVASQCRKIQSGHDEDMEVDEFFS